MARKPAGKKVKKTTKKRVWTEEQKQQARESLAKARAAIGKTRKERGDVRGIRSTSTPEAIVKRLRKADIVTFAHMLRLRTEGYPFFELILRCSEGLELPGGMVKTYVERQSDGFAVEEVEMTWPEYFALCSCGSKTYTPGVRPQIILARAGRRSSKSTAATIKALYSGSRPSIRDYVRPSEVVRIPIIATSQDQAEAIIKQRCHEVLKDAKLEWLIGPLDPQLHQNQVTNDTIPLIFGTEIVAYPCNSKRVRGEAAPLVEFDEYPAFAIEGRKKDKDIRIAAMGAQAQFPESQFMAIGTPAAAEGDFWELEQAAADTPSILALHAPSWTAAPILYKNNPDFYHNAFKTDPQGFDREYRANYAESMEPMYRPEDVDAALCLTGEAPFDSRCRYGAGVDQSGLAGNDRFALVIAYYDPYKDVVGVALERSWGVSDLDLIMSDSRAILRRYGIYEVMTDQYAKGYVSSAFAKAGFQCVSAPRAADLHFSFRRMLVARKVELPTDSDITIGLKKTQCAYTAKSHLPSVYHPRDQYGHGDIIEGLVRAARQAVEGNYSNSPYDSTREMEDIEKAEADYDPLAFTA